MPIATTILISLFSGCVVAFLSFYLQQKNERIKFFREKLLERYSEFVAAASAEVDRTKVIKSALALQSTDDERRKTDEVDSKRHESRVVLARLALQIRLLEADMSLADKVRQLSQTQPYITFPGHFSMSALGGEQRYDKYCTDIHTFELLLEDIIASVVGKYSHPQTQLLE